MFLVQLFTIFFWFYCKIIESIIIVKFIILLSDIELMFMYLNVCVYFYRFYIIFSTYSRFHIFFYYFLNIIENICIFLACYSFTVNACGYCSIMFNVVSGHIQYLRFN